MHLFRTYRHIFSLRVSSFAYLLIFPSIIAGFVVGFEALVHSDEPLMAWVLVSWFGALVFFIIHRIFSSMCRCPLCQNPPMGAKSCGKHRSAMKLLGSYRATVALSVLFRNQFRCPYCGEPSQCKLRYSSR